MFNKMTFTALAVVFLAATAADAQPRPDKTWKNWFGHVNGSFVRAEGEAGDVLDDGTSFGGGATYWPEDWKIGLVLDTNYTEFDLSSEAIRRVNQAIIDDGGEGRIDGGDASIWSFTVNGTWSPTRGQGFYVTAGVGVYDFEARITETGLVYWPPICSPWYWWCRPGGVGPGNFVRGSVSSTEFGWNAGIGFAFEVGTSGSQVFIESRYHSVSTSPEATQYLPLTIGFRW